MDHTVPRIKAAALLLLTLLLTCCVPAGETSSDPNLNTPLDPTGTLRPPASTATPSPALPSPTATVTPPPALGRIVFLSDRDRDGNDEIYIMNADGSGQTRLIDTACNVDGLVGSPAGDFIAFSADCEGDTEIYRMKTDGTDLIRLTTSPGWDLYPEWSPDGEWLLFTTQRDRIEGHEGPPPEIYMMDKDGGGQKRLTNNTTSDYCPAWSPDMTGIAFSSFADDYDSTRIDVMASDGSDSHLLVDLPSDDLCPKWSPDGQTIAFFTIHVTEGYSYIWLMSVDEMDPDPLRLFDVPVKIHSVRWSPDGQWLVFTADTGSGWDIYRTTLDGQVLVNLTSRLSGDNHSPSWIP